MADESLVPVFIPALGAVFIIAEDQKGSPLDEDEVIRIRDQSACIMMEVADAAKLNERRGWDIDPENCWHDWQKLRDELGRTPSLPRGPKFNLVRSEDDEYLQTVAGARSSLSVFRNLLTAVGDGAIIKARLKYGENHANMWLNEVQDLGKGFSGVLFEVPAYLTGYLVGQRIEVLDEELLDWMVNADGYVQGGYSIRFFRQMKPEAERAEYDDYIGITEYAPLPTISAE